MSTRTYRCSETYPDIFPDIRFEDPDAVSDNIRQSLDIPYDVAEIIRLCMSKPPPKIQLWNDYMGRATVRSQQDHEIFMFDWEEGMIGPLGIADKKASYSLSRKLIGPVENAINHFIQEEDDKYLVGVREKVILTKLLNGTVSTREVAEHENTAPYHIAGEYSPDLKVSPDDFRDFTYTKHRVLPAEETSRTYLTDEKGIIVEDAEIVVAANWYVLTLTRSGNLYFNQGLYMEHVRSIAKATTECFVLILDETHANEFHRNDELISYLRDQDTRGDQDDIKDLKSRGFDFGLRDSSIPAVARTTYIDNSEGYMGLMADGRLIGNYWVPTELETHLADDGSNYVEKLVASSTHFAALLKLSNEGQKVYVWGSSIRMSFNYTSANTHLHPLYLRKNLENGKLERKRIVDIVPSTIYEDEYLADDVFGINFEEDVFCLMSKQGMFMLPSITEHIQSIYNTTDGMLIVTRSGNLHTAKISGQESKWNIVTMPMRPQPISFVALPEGFIFSYRIPRNTTENKQTTGVLGKKLKLSDRIKENIKNAQGIAEIHFNRGLFYVMLKNGTFELWTSYSAGSDHGIAE